MGKKMDWIEACLGRGGWGHRMIQRPGCGTVGKLPGKWLEAGELGTV